MPSSYGHRRSTAAATATPPAPALRSVAHPRFLVRFLLLLGVVRDWGSANCASALEARFQPAAGGRGRAVLALLTQTAIGCRPSDLWAGRCSFRSTSLVHFAGRLIGVAGGRLFQFVGFFLILKFEEVGHIEEGVAFEAYVDKCRLHAGQNPGYAPVVNGTGQCVFVFAFVIDFRELIVFKYCQPRLMRRAGDANLFCHRTFPPGGVACRGLRQGGMEEARNRKGRECAKGMTCEWPARRKSRSRRPLGAANRCDCSDRNCVRAVVRHPNAEVCGQSNAGSDIQLGRSSAGFLPARRAV